MRKFVSKWDWAIVWLVSFAYYSILSSKIFTWIFTSGDSGDWLASSIWWMNCQPYGSPLYVLLGQFIHFIVPNNLIIGMTLGLSVLPASITVLVVYLIVKKLANVKCALVSVLVLLGSAVFLSQAIILEEYAISSMFVACAFWFYINDKKKLTVLMLALGSAVHVIVIIISVVWLIANFREIKQWLHTIPIYIVFGILPYSMVLILMYLDTPRLLAPSLSLEGLDNYLGSTGTIGSLSLYEAPKRLLQFVGVVCMSLGFAVLPLFFAFKGVVGKKSMLVCIATVLVTVWLYITNGDPSTWTFLNFGFPLIIVLIGIGLSKMEKAHMKVVMYGALGLILLNGVFLNANVLSHEYPLATEYEKSVSNLPENSYLVCNSGGQYGLANYYFMAEGKNIIPVFYSADTPTYEGMLELVKEQNKGIKLDDAHKLATENYERSLNSPRHLDYMKWANLTEKETTKEVERLLEQGENVFIVTPTITPYWENVFKVLKVDDNISRVVGVY
jgi:hypothetical protein